MKPFRSLERMVRGFANHRRIQMIELLARSPELSLQEVAAILRINLKTASEHLRRLAIAGLVLKQNEGSFVRHRLTDRAQNILKFLRTLE